MVSTKQILRIRPAHRVTEGRVTGPTRSATRTRSGCTWTAPWDEWWWIRSVVSMWFQWWWRWSRCKFQWWLNGKWGVEIDFHQRFTGFQHLASICWVLRTNLYGSPDCLGVFSWKLGTVYYSKWSTLVVLVGHFCWYCTCWMYFTWRDGSVFFPEQ
jgi:hypothetical protein